MRKIVRLAEQTEMYSSTKAANGSQCREDMIREELEGAQHTAIFHQCCCCVTTRRHQQLQTQQRSKAEWLSTVFAVLSTVFENDSEAPREDIDDQTLTTARLLTEMREGARWRASYIKLSTVACDPLMGRHNLLSENNIETIRNLSSPLRWAVSVLSVLFHDETMYISRLYLVL